MPGALANASAWLASQRARHLARDVTYAPRDGSSGVVVKATPVRAAREDVQDVEFGQEVGVVDWVIEASALDLGSGPREPEPGDRIIDRTADPEVCYRVVRSGDTPAWTWTDAQRRSIRISTRSD